MARLIFGISCFLLAVCFTKGDNEGPFIGGRPESDVDTWYDIHYSVMKETIYESTPTLDNSSIHELGLDLEYYFDQVQSTKNQSSLAAGKILFIAEELKKNDNIKEHSGTVEIVDNIIQKSTLFAKKLATSYACHGVEAIKYVEDEHQENNDYIIFYNPDEPEKISKAKILDNPIGDKMIFTIEHKHRLGFVLKYYILIDNADYPEEVKLLADKTSNKIVSLEETNDEEICEMESKPRARICTPMTKMFNMTRAEAAQAAETRFQFMKNNIKICN